MRVLDRIVCNDYTVTDDTVRFGPMPRLKDYHLTPAQFAELTGLPVAMQRVWRMRGFLDGVGEQGGNGRWSFSYFDAINIGCIKKLTDRGIPLKLAIMFFTQSCDQIFRWLTALVADSKKDPADRFFYSYRLKGEGDNSEGDEWYGDTFGGGFEDSEAVLRAAEGGFLIDCKQVADRLPEVVKDAWLDNFGPEAGEA